MIQKQNKQVVVEKETFLQTYKSPIYANLSLTKYSEFFPIKVSVELAEIVASLLTDGFVDIRPYYKSKYYGYIGYFSKDEKELEKFNKKLIKLFGIKGTIREWGIRDYGISKGCIIINSFLSRILNLAGVPSGDKIKNEYALPDWIYYAKENIKKAFLRRSFSCEGSVGYDRNGKRWEIRYSMYKSDLILENARDYLERMSDILKGFNIENFIYTVENYIRKKDKIPVTGLCLKIGKKKSLLRFAKYIGFDIDYKKERLSKAVIWARKANRVVEKNLLKPVA